MPIPAPSPASLLADAIPAGSPFWLCVNGVWVQIEGVVPSTAVGSERARSSVTTEGGNRYEQRAREVRRTWEWSLPHAEAPHVAVARVAVESEADVWLMADPVAGLNMLPPRSCFGTTLPAMLCGDVPLATFAGGETVTGRVRGGVSTTLSGWSDAAAATTILTATYPGGVATVQAAGGTAQASVSFVPTEDGEVSIAVADGAWSTTGLMLTEGAAPAGWTAGERMPCKVVVDDPADVLTMFHSGAWRHDYSITLREIG
jgi:hypothetical protein